MNTQKLIELVTHLKRIDNSDTSTLGFDMEEGYFGREDTQHPCGTACCIEGHAEAMYGNVEYGPEGVFWEQFFGVTKLSWSEITEPATIDVGKYSEITPEHAISMLEHFINTGKVDWPLAMRNA